VSDIMTMRKVLVLLAVLALTIAGCGKSEEKPAAEGAAPAAKPAAAAAKVDPATAATVTGNIKFTGTVPRPAKIDMSQDPGCLQASKGPSMVETIKAEGGNLADAFVYVKSGLPAGNYEGSKDAVTIDQTGCHYEPHVVGVMTGQTVRILNSDPTTHNIHPTPKNNREWNESQPPKGTPLEKTFAREEIMLPVKCNQHPWMKMYVNVVPHPFFAVSGKDGKFEIKGLPPGTYTVAAVHEKLGEQTMQVTVGASESKAVDFSFGGATAGGMQ
jgi:plastocyanin